MDSQYIVLRNVVHLFVPVFNKYSFVRITTHFSKFDYTTAKKKREFLNTKIVDHEFSFEGADCLITLRKLIQPLLASKS